MNLRFWVRRPHLLAARARYWVWERLNPDKPWLCPGSVRFCERHLTAGMTGLEFGSGRSTAWFAGRLGRLVSVEHNREWYEKVRADLAARAVANVDYRLVPLDHPEAEPERPAYDPPPRYAAVADEFPDGSLDFVVVDGHYRSTCIRRCLAKVRPGGLLLVDDVNLWPTRAELPVPADWAAADLSGNGLKQTGIWRKPG
jgi:predicted O-methyltransferase YrrM